MNGKIPHVHGPQTIRQGCQHSKLTDATTANLPSMQGDCVPSPALQRKKKKPHGLFYIVGK